LLYLKRAKRIYEGKRILAYTWATLSSDDTGQDRRFHRSMKNIIIFNHYYLPWDLEKEIEEFVNFYNNERYPESINNFRAVDVYDGRCLEILDRREKIKRKKMIQRRRHNLKQERIKVL